MKKLLGLILCVSVLWSLLIHLAPPSGAQKSSEVITQRKLAAKQRKVSSPQTSDITEIKRMAAAKKSQPTSADVNSENPEAPFIDPLLQSPKPTGPKSGVATQDVGRSLTSIQQFGALRMKALSAGTVRVIVEMRTSFQPEGDLRTVGAVQKQRRDIASSQENLLRETPGILNDSVKRFEFVPYLAFETSIAGLDHLRTSADVTNIFEDVALPATLAESVPLIGAPAAWAAGFSGAGQTVAILDTGVDKTHSFLAGKVVSEACYSTSSFAQSSSSVCPGGVSESTSSGSGLNCSGSVPGCDHGTHVAGIAAGKGSSFSGVARDANIIAIQVFSRFDSFSTCSSGAPCALSFTSDQIKGLERVFALRSTFNIASVNMSLGGGQFSSNCDSQPHKAAIDNLRSVGIATVIASGNDGFKSAISAPGCISSAISVGSTGDGSGATGLNAVSSFSNSSSFLNLLAPGNLIRSSVPGNGFANFQGTSMATPHVAGAWAVLKSKSPGASVSEVYAALRDTGLQVTDTNGITKPRIRVDAAVNALGGGGGGGGNCGAPVSISSGQTVNGALDSTDCRYPSGSDHFSDAYTFSGTSGQQISITMSSGAFDTLLFLNGPNGVQVATDDDGGGGTNSRIPATSGFFTLPSTGTYTIQASSFSANTAGTYSLALTSQTPSGCSSPVTINFGQTINGTLSGSDCRFTDNSFFDAYTFSGVAGQQVSVSMASGSFDTFLFLLRPDGTTLSSDDDGGGGTDSRIPTGSGSLTLPTTGIYTIYTSSFSPNTTGAYSLTLNGQTLGGSCPSTPISIGQTFNGTLSLSDCQLSDNSLFDSYSFSGTAGQTISVSLTSPVFDTYLHLLRPDGTLLADDDDGGDGLNSRIPAESGTLTLPVTGTYKILANSFSPNVTGSYSLTLQGSSAFTCPSTPISIGQLVNGVLSNSDCTLSDNSFIDSYSFTGTAGQQVAVEMSSLNFDTYLFLLGPNGLVVDDDDGGAGTDSRIPANTGFFTLPTSGTYTILANSFAPTVTGGYALSLVSGQSGCTFSLNPTGQSIAFSGGSGSISILAGSGCGWAAVSNASWLTITSTPNGSGNGSINFSAAANGTQETRTGTITVSGQTFTLIQSTNTVSNVQFTSSSASVNESSGKIDVTVVRSGNTAVGATIDFATSDVSADRRKDYTQTLGTLIFNPGETSKTISILLTDDTFAESTETFTITLSNANGTTVGPTSVMTVSITSNDAVTGPNPVEWNSSFNSTFFVRQHYIDMLNREPDSGGLAFWVNEIESCGANQQCREVKRINVSAAFFLSIEFQETGYLVYRLYKSAYGDTTSPTVGGTVPIIRLSEFLPDTVRLGRNVQVGIGDWQNQLETNKNALSVEFVQRPRFLGAFPTSMTPTQFVDKLNLNSGSVLSSAERSQLINELTSNNTVSGRASVLRKVAEDADLRQRELNRAFVLMQYYGYLRRNPDDPQDTNFGGWKFWLDKLNLFNGDYVNAEMVKAFLLSLEYKQRFGPG